MKESLTALAAQLDGLEIAAGGTVTPDHVAALAAVSTALKALAESPVETVAVRRSTKPAAHTSDE